MIKKLSTLLTLIGAYLFVTLPAYAQNVNPCPQNTENFNVLCDYGLGSVGKLVRTSISILFIVAVIASLFFLIAGGIKWITSGGDKANLEQARNWIVAAAVGLIITFSSYFIINIILEFFGLPNVNNYIIPTLG